MLCAVLIGGEPLFWELSERVRLRGGTVSGVSFVVDLSRKSSEVVGVLESTKPL